jgi:hypothetical protein
MLNAIFSASGRKELSCCLGVSSTDQQSGNMNDFDQLFVCLRSMMEIAHADPCGL